MSVDFSKPPVPAAPSRPEGTHRVAARSQNAAQDDAHHVQTDAIGKPMHRLRGQVFTGLIGIQLFATSMLMGSNRPVAWMLWTLIFALMACLYLAARPMPPSLRGKHVPHLGLFSLFALPVGMGLLQALPLPSALPNSLAPQATLLGVLRYAGFLILGLLVYDLCHRGPFAGRFLRLIFGGIVLHALWAMVALRFLGDLALWGEKTSYLGWATGGFVNRNSFATYLGIGVVAGLSIALERDGKRTRRSGNPRARAMWVPASLTMKKAWVWMGVLVLVTTLLATGSRMGILACLVATGSMFGVVKLAPHARAPQHRFLKWLRLAVLFAAAIFVLDVLGSGDGLDVRFLAASQDAQVRLALYAQVWDMAAAAPLSGIGLDSFQIGYPLVHDAPVPFARVWDLAHNTYLALWTELGFIAGSGPILASVLVGASLVTARRRGEAQGAPPVATLGVLVLVGIHSLVDFSLEIAANSYLFAVFIALGLSRTRRDVSGQL